MDRPLKVKHHSLTGRITLELMHSAFRRVRRNKGRAGVDKVSIEMFQANLEQNLLALMRDLKQGTFQPKPARRSYIDKGGGKLRPLGIPTVRDRVAQEVLRQLLSPLFEREFHDNSYGFRPGRSCHTALKQVKQLHQAGYRHLMDADIRGCFDHLSHAAIVEGLTNVVADGNIIRLVREFLNAGVMEDGVVHPSTRGTPQGGVLSPLLANIALNFLDWHLDRLGYRFVRYADDFVVLCQSEHQAKEARLAVELFITERLGVTLSQEKTHVTTFRKGFSFLGFDVKANSWKMRAKSVEKFKDKVREITCRCHNLDQDVVVRLNALVRGVARYFGTEFSTCVLQFRDLDEGVRKRIRCMKYKRISRNDNRRLHVSHMRAKGLVFLSDFLPRSREQCFEAAPRKRPCRKLASTHFTEMTFARGRPV